MLREDGRTQLFWHHELEDIDALGAHNSQHTSRRRGREKSCPPRGPHLVDAVREDFYVARCLACGLTGPAREAALEAKLTFDQGWP